MTTDTGSAEPGTDNSLDRGRETSDSVFAVPPYRVSQTTWPSSTIEGVFRNTQAWTSDPMRIYVPAKPPRYIAGGQPPAYNARSWDHQGRYFFVMTALFVLLLGITRLDFILVSVIVCVLLFEESQGCVYGAVAGICLLFSIHAFPNLSDPNLHLTSFIGTCVGICLASYIADSYRRLYAEHCYDNILPS